jgi:hypothetical protein
MNKMNFENQLNSIASGMEYPPTPDIAGTVAMRLRVSTRPRFFSKRLAWSLTIVLVLLSSLMLIPTARAAIIEFIQIGIVRIFPQPQVSPIEMVPTTLPQNETPMTATSQASLPSLIPLLESVSGERDLAHAQNIAPYPILLPKYPSDLGEPYYVFVQDADGAMTNIVWMDRQQPQRVRLSLHFIPTGSWAINKMGPRVIQETRVNGQDAIWAEGPYPLFMQNGELTITRLIEGNVLIWADGDVTYRLETDQDLEEAIKTAESLKPIN